MAGWSVARLTTASPAVRVDTAWKSPESTLYPIGISVTSGSLSCIGEPKDHSEGYQEAHIQNNEKNEVCCVEYDEGGK